MKGKSKSPSRGSPKAGDGESSEENPKPDSGDNPKASRRVKKFRVVSPKPDGPPVYHEDRDPTCPFFTVRYAVLFVGSMFSLTGTVMMISSFVVEKIPGYHSVARAHGIDTFRLSLCLMVPALLLFLIECIFECSRERFRNDITLEFPQCVEKCCGKQAEDSGEYRSTLQRSE